MHPGFVRGGTQGQRPSGSIPMHVPVRACGADQRISTPLWCSIFPFEKAVAPGSARTRPGGVYLFDAVSDDPADV